MTRQEFASLLKDFRLRENLTQEAAASFLDVSLRTWQNWEIARNMPRGFGLRALVLALQRPAPAPSRPRPRKSPPRSAAAGAPQKNPPLRRAKRPAENAPGVHSALDAHLL